MEDIPPVHEHCPWTTRKQRAQELLPRDGREWEGCVTVQGMGFIQILTWYTVLRLGEISVGICGMKLLAIETWQGTELISLVRRWRN